MEFTYTALTKEGHRETGSLQAGNEALAGHLLKEQGLLPTHLEEKRSNTDFFSKFKNIGLVSLDEKIGFVQNMAVMMKAGISVSRALQIIVKQTKSAKFKGIVADIAQQVESGKSLGDALAKYPNVFSNIFVSMVKVGEMSGNLEKSLDYLGIQLQRDADLRSKVKGAMIYPSVIIAAMLIIGVLMAIFVLPGLVAQFKDFSANLPLSTKIVIALSDFMQAHSVLVIILMIGAVGGLIAFYRTSTGGRLFDQILVHFFMINTIVKKINLARFARILSSLLKSGIPIVQGLEVSSESMGNVLYREVVADAAVEVKLGKPLTEALNKNGNLFPVIVVQMIQVGEESGTVEEILGQLAQHYEEEVDVTLRNLSSIIEPLLLLAIGGVVAVLAMALIAPIYQISGSIK